MKDWPVKEREWEEARKRFRLQHHLTQADGEALEPACSILQVSPALVSLLGSIISGEQP